MSFIDLHTNVSLGHTKIVGLGDEKLWLCPTLGGDKLDISGNGNHGTYYGGMGTVALSGSGGTRSYDFDGTNDRIDCPADTLGGSSTISMSCWVYQDSHDSINGQGFMGQVVSGGATTDRVALLWSPASGSGKAVRSIIFRNTSGSFAEAYWGSPPPPLNAWHHWCMTADGSTISLYKDGTLVDSTAYSGSPPASPTNSFEIGRYKGGGSNDIFCLDGKMDDVRVFHRALTQEEVKHLASKRGVLGTPRNPVIKKRRIFYAPTAPVTTTAKAVVLKKPKPSYATGYARNASESANPNLWKGLVGAWMPSFGVTGGTLKDVSGNGNDGTLTNMDAASDWVGTSKGLALDFDGSNDYVIASYQASPEITVVSNVRFDSFAGASVTKNWGDNLRGAFHFDASTLGSGYLALFIYAGAQISIKDPTQLSTGKWYQVGLRITNSKYQIIRDGNFVAEGSHGGLSILDRPNLGIGVKLNNDGTTADSRFPKYLDGQISNVVAYNRALSPSEIKQLYLNPSAPFLRKQQTVGISTAAVVPSANFNPFSVLTHPLEQ